jgi:hypothetical protein
MAVALVIVLSALVLIACAVAFCLAQRAPEGYEDETGFYLVPSPAGSEDSMTAALGQPCEEPADEGLAVMPLEHPDSSGSPQATSAW